MNSITFDQAIEGLLEREGGYVRDPHDRGGVTKYGISLKFLKDNNIDLTGDGIVDDRDIEALTLEQAKEIYRVHFWNWLKCEELPSALAIMIFDFGVNAGRYRAARFLQVAVHRLQEAAGHPPEYRIKVDGVIGPKTLHGTWMMISSYPIRLTAALISKILFHYPSCKTWEHHGRGWIRRWGKTLREVSETEGGA